MRTFPYRLLALVLVALCVAGAAAQGGQLRLAPYTITGAFLNDQILGDTLANGARRDSNCTYILSRGGLYLSNAPIRNIAWPLSIKANDSTANKPVVFLAPNPTSGLPPGQFVDVRGNLTVKNLIISGYDERVDSLLGGLQGALFNMSSPGYNIVIDSCILTNTNGNHVRTDQAPHLVKITNCIFGNMGYLGRSNLGAGKGIDVRGGSVDSLIMVNNTFVNWQDRIIRHFGATANIRYLRFEHNTLVNGMSYHGTLSLGRVGPNALIANNLFFDSFALGADTDAVRQAEFTDSGEKDSFGGARMTWVIANPSDSVTWNIRNNYYVVSDTGQAFFTNAGANPALWEGPPLTWKINSKLGADSVKAFQKVTLALNKIPKLMTAMMRWYRTPAASGGAGKSKSTTNFAARYDYDRKSYRYWRDTLDCKYPTSSPLYTAASGGYPVGDLNWYPSRKAAWDLDAVSTDVPAEDGVPTSYALNQNYPNPFNPSTKISFNLEKNAMTTLTVYNVLGQRIATLVSGELAAGKHEVAFDAARLSTGVYFYRLESGNFFDVKKMLLLK